MPGALERRFRRWFELGPEEARRSLPLEGLRGAAAGLVFLVHYASLAGPWMQDPVTSALFGVLGVLGNAGVDLFFALSGYLIYGSLIRRRQAFLPYMRRRVVRLYPAFLAVLALYLLISVAAPSTSRVPPGLGAGAAYLLANVLLLPGLFPITPIITVAWSLSYELGFYLALPVLIGVLRLRAWPSGARIGLILAGIVAAQLAGLPHPRIGMFACGMVLAEAAPWLARRGPWLSVAALAGLPLSAAALLRGGAEPMEDMAAFSVVFATVFALCGSALTGHGPIARALSVRPLRWFGNMSYSFYLLHGALLNGFFLALAQTGVEGPAAPWVMLAPAFAVAFAGSAALFLLVERRFSLTPAKSGIRPDATPAANRPYNPSRLRSPASP